MAARKSHPERKSRSGSYVHEAQRGTVRVRLPRAAHEQAEELAERQGREVAEVIAGAIESTYSAMIREREERGDVEYERMIERDLEDR
jgi:predicted HicB family RNase H-like nuclease